MRSGERFLARNFVATLGTRGWQSIGRRFPEAVTKVYSLSGTLSEPFRSQVIDELRAFFSHGVAEWEILRHYELKTKSTEDLQVYFGRGGISGKLCC